MAGQHSRRLSVFFRLSGMARMNIFTTEHPMASQSSWFDTKEHPRLSFICRTFVLAMILAPFVFVRLYYYAISDIGAEPKPFPQPWWCFFMGAYWRLRSALYVRCPSF